jgi:hypothetical protein
MLIRVALTPIENRAGYRLHFTYRATRRTDFFIFGQLVVFLRVFDGQQLRRESITTTERPEQTTTLDVRQVLIQDRRRGNNGGEFTRVLAGLDDSTATLLRVDIRDVNDVAITGTIKPEIREQLPRHPTIHQTMQVNMPLTRQSIVRGFPKDEATPKMRFEQLTTTQFLEAGAQVFISTGQVAPVLDGENYHHRVEELSNQVHQLFSYTFSPGPEAICTNTVLTGEVDTARAFTTAPTVIDNEPIAPFYV